MQRVADGELTAGESAGRVLRPSNLADPAVASVALKQVRKVAFGEDDAPQATDADRSWREVLPVAVLHAAIFGLVKAAIDRGAAESTRKVTGVWPGEEDQ